MNTKKPTLTFSGKDTKGKQMREMKITNYTTRDWLKQMGSLFCFLAVAQCAFLVFQEGNWYFGIMFCLGAVGWMIIYTHINKNIEKKNPQEEK